MSSLQGVNNALGEPPALYYNHFETKEKAKAAVSLLVMLDEAPKVINRIATSCLIGTAFKVASVYYDTWRGQDGDLKIFSLRFVQTLIWDKSHFPRYSLVALLATAAVLYGLGRVVHLLTLPAVDYFTLLTEVYAGNKCENNEPLYDPHKRFKGNGTEDSYHIIGFTWPTTHFYYRQLNTLQPHQILKDYGYIDCMVKASRFYSEDRGVPIPIVDLQALPPEEEPYNTAVNKAKMQLAFSFAFVKLLLEDEAWLQNHPYTYARANVQLQHIKFTDTGLHVSLEKRTDSPLQLAIRSGSSWSLSLFKMWQLIPQDLLDREALCFKFAPPTGSSIKPSDWDSFLQEVELPSYRERIVKGSEVEVA